jgi:hypothetical protein
LSSRYWLFSMGDLLNVSPAFCIYLRASLCMVNYERIDGSMSISTT